MADYKNWENLLDDSCPSCGELFDKEGENFICRNHAGKPFVIPEKKFKTIVRDLEDKRWSGGSWIRNI